MNRLLISALCLLPSVFWSSAATIIGTEARLAVPGIATNASQINWRPGSGSTVTLNPPIFSWNYDGSETNGTAEDSRVRTFLFEVSYTNWGALAFSKTTELNFFNALAPFTNGTSPIYWRVTFYTNGVQERVSNVRNFTVTNSPTYWDRHWLDDDSYIASKTTHPYLWGITAASRSNINYGLTAGDSLGMYLYLRQNATNYLNTLSNAGWAAIVPSNANRASYESCFENLSFQWQMTRDPIWVTNGGVSIGEPFNKYVEFYITNHIWSEDYYANGSSAAAIGYGFDWLYDILTPLQRSNAVVAIDLSWQGSRTHFWRDTYDRTWTGYFADFWYEGVHTNLDYGSAFFVGSAHPMVQANHMMVAMMAGVNENTNILAGWRRMVNYMMSKAYPYSVVGGSTQGRSYAQAGTAESQDNTFPLYLQLEIAFPELGMTNTPFLKETADWWTYGTPVGHDQVAGPWGDADISVFRWIGKDTLGKNLAIAAQSPGLFGSFLGQSNVNYVDTGADPWSVAGVSKQMLLTGYQMPIPTPNTNLPTYKVMPEDGWVFSASGSPNVQGTFTNGTWSMFMAAPAGIEANHGYFNHGNFELGAYGSIISRGGDNNIGRKRGTWSHNVVVPRGLGQFSRQEYQDYDVVSHIIAFTNSSDFTYAAVDTTRAYQAKVPPQGQSTPTVYVAANQLVGGLNQNRDLALVERHMLHMRGKYWVFYDKLRTDGTTNITWGFPYHVENNSRVLTPSTNDYPTPGTNEFYLEIKNGTGPNLAIATNALTGTNVYYTGRMGVSNCISIDPWSFYYLRTNRLNDTVKTIVVSVATNGLARHTYYGTNVNSNPITGENWNDPVDHEGYAWEGAVAWFTNSTPQSNWTFLTVIYPVKPGDADPTITRVDANTVAVTNGADGDVISFDTNRTDVATLIVDAGATNALPQQRAVTPTFSPSGPVVSVLPTNIVLSTSPVMDQIFWWTNSGPTNVHSGDVSINYGVTLNAFATNSGMLDSFVLSVTFTTNEPVMAESPSFDPPAGTYSNSVAVTLSSDTPSATFIWTTNAWAVTNTGATITLTNDATLSAATRASGYTESPPASASYVVTNAPASSGTNGGITINANTINVNILFFR